MLSAQEKDAYLEALESGRAGRRSSRWTSSWPPSARASCASSSATTSTTRACSICGARADSGSNAPGAQPRSQVSPSPARGDHGHDQERHGGLDRKRTAFHGARAPACRRPGGVALARIINSTVGPTVGSAVGDSGPGKLDPIEFERLSPFALEDENHIVDAGDRLAKPGLDGLPRLITGRHAGASDERAGDAPQTDLDRYAPEPAETRALNESAPAPKSTF